MVLLLNKINELALEKVGVLMYLRHVEMHHVLQRVLVDEARNRKPLA